MKKVLLMIPSLNIGGMERMLVNVANLLVQHGNDVTVLNLSGEANSIIKNLSKNVKYKNYVIPKKFFLHAKLVDYVNLNIRFLPYSLWVKFHSAKYLHKLYVKENYDVEIAFYTGYCVKIINGCPKSTKKIFWLHGEAWQMDGITQGYFTKKNAEKVYKKYDQIVCVSDKIRKDFYSRFGEDSNVITISNFNDAVSIKEMSQEFLDLSKNSFTFVIVGRIDNNHKGFDRVIDAKLRLQKEGYNFLLWVVGDGPDLNILKDKVEKQKICDVVFLGMQENPYKFIKNADALICSSHYEGYGLVVSEAMILGKAVISTNVTGPAEILDNGKYGLLVENSTEGIYFGMKSFLDNPSMVEYYSKKSIERCNVFYSEKIFEKIESILK